MIQIRKTGSKIGAPLGAHIRRHVQRGIKKIGCNYCEVISG